MPFNINDFRGQLQFGGARPTKFEVLIQNPVNSLGDIKTPFMVKAASLPPLTIGTIPVPYFGRQIQEAGDRTYEPWTVTVLNDEDFLIRNALEEWNHAINSPEGNVSKLENTLGFTSQAQVIQYSKTGLPVREVTFRNIWPSDISSIELGWDQTDTIEEYTVTFQLDSWDVTGGITGNAGGAA